MPKGKLLTFDGDPLNYWLLVNNFQVSITKRVPDTKSRLVYLIQHCSGKPREAIKKCAIISDWVSIKCRLYTGYKMQSRYKMQTDKKNYCFSSEMS